MLSIPKRVVSDYAIEKHISLDLAEYHFQELIKFLIVCASAQKRCAPSEALDAPWHSFVMFTKEYRDFCLINFGRIIDHDPSPKEKNVEAYVRTRALAAERFGDLDKNFWPKGELGATCCGATMCGAVIDEVAAVA